MQLNVPADLEMLIKKRLSSGGYTDAEDVVRRALEAQDAEESLTSRKAIDRPNAANESTAHKPAVRFRG